MPIEPAVTDPVSQAESAWQNAESLVQRVEQASRSSIAPEAFFADLVNASRLTSGARAVTLWIDESDEQTVLARAGIAAHDDREAERRLGGTADGFAGTSRWSDGPKETSVLLAIQG